MTKKHYGSIDGLRMLAAFGIVIMHIKVNTNYQISGYVYDRIIPSFTNFVFLFMTVSAFGMCCGYFDKVLNNQLSLSKFYGKRFKKILPFFGVLVLLDVALSPSLASVYEGFADVTLLFGFLPNDISVIGVGWFLGLIFIFYLVFPFFCVLLENKRRAWIAFAVSLIYNFACTNYFDVGRKNMLFSACFFIAGGLIYLYRDKIEKLNQWLALGIAVISVALYYIIGGNTYMCLLVSCTLLIYAVTNRTRVLDNRVTRFFGSISMEIYLSHMMIFRIVEKLGIINMFGNGLIQYLITSAVVLCGVTVFSFVMHKIIEAVMNKIENRTVTKKSVN